MVTVSRIPIRCACEIASSTVEMYVVGIDLKLCFEQTEIRG